MPLFHLNQDVEVLDELNAYRGRKARVVGLASWPRGNVYTVEVAGHIRFPVMERQLAAA